MLNDSDQNGILALQDAKRRIESLIETKTNELAILRKRHDALSLAIDVLRAPDSELSKMAATPKQVKEFVQMNPSQVEGFIVEKVMVNGPVSKAHIENMLRQNGIPYNDTGLRTVLTTCPLIVKVGERSLTQYKLK